MSTSGSFAGMARDLGTLGHIARHTCSTTCTSPTSSRSTSRSLDVLGLVSCWTPLFIPRHGATGTPRVSDRPMARNSVPVGHPARVAQCWLAGPAGRQLGPAGASWQMQLPRLSPLRRCSVSLHRYAQSRAEAKRAVRGDPDAPPAGSLKGTGPCHSWEQAFGTTAAVACASSIAVPTAQ